MSVSVKQSAEQDPRLAGYESWEGHDPFEDHSGPYFFKEQADGSFKAAYLAAPHTVNGLGVIHGGSLMTFADYALFVICKNSLKDHYGLTVSFNCDLVAGGVLGEFIEAEGQVIQETRTMIFVQGLIFTERDDERTTLMRFSGIIRKKLRESGKGRD